MTDDAPVERVLATGQPGTALLYLFGSTAASVFGIWMLVAGEGPDGPQRHLFTVVACGICPALVVVLGRFWVLLSRHRPMVVERDDELHVLDSGLIWPRRRSVNAAEVESVEVLKLSWFGRVHGQQLWINRREGPRLIVMSPLTGRPAAELKDKIDEWLDRQPRTD